MPEDLRRLLSWRSARRQPQHTDASVARARRVLIVCCVAAAGAVTGVIALLVPQGEDLLPAPPAAVVFPTPAADPSEVLVPSDPPANSIGIPSGASETTSVATSKPETTGPAPPPPTTTRPTSPAPVFTVGATIGLEVQRFPGFRVRHRNFLGRVDRLSSASSASDRADSRFVVRRGLGRSSCVSLEAVNFPGQFLRHRDFVIHLDRRDGTRLFDQDATFCPQPTGGDGAVLLKAINFPDQGIALQGDNTLHLDDDGITAFAVRNPL
jgi:hypothetical protein